MSAIQTSDEAESRLIEDVVRCNLISRKHTILCGPPGTGKTRCATLVTNQLSKEGVIGTTQSVQFHPQYSYQDFIEGYTVKEGGFEPRDGIFKKFLEDCEKNGGKETLNVFTIDEINRADISSVFGELMGLLDNSHSRNVILPNSGETITMGSNVVILGTMNSADRNIAIMDFALRRRFNFVFVPPDYGGLETWLNQYGIDSETLTIPDYVGAIRELNHRIISHPLLGRDMALGQSFFVPRKSNDGPISEAEIAQQFRELVIPQVESYLGQGATTDLAELLSPTIAQRASFGLEMVDDEILGLLNALIESKEIEE